MFSVDNLFSLQGRCKSMVGHLPNESTVFPLLRVEPQRVVMQMRFNLKPLITLPRFTNYDSWHSMNQLFLLINMTADVTSFHHKKRN